MQGFLQCADHVRVERIAAFRAVDREHQPRVLPAGLDDGRHAATSISFGCRRHLRHAGLHHLANLLARVAGLGQHLRAVLAQQRRRAQRRQRRLRPFAGHRHRSQHALGGMLELLEEPDVLQVRVVQQRLEGVRRQHRDAERLQQLAPFLRGPGLQLVGQDLVQRLDMLRARFAVGEPRVALEPLGLADRAHEGLPLLVGVDDEAHQAVLRGVRPPLRVEQPRIAEAAARRDERVAVQMVAQHHLRGRLEHRHVDRLPAARAFAREQRRADHAERVQARRAVREVERGVARHVGSRPHAGLGDARRRPGSGRRRRATPHSGRAG